MMTEQKKESGQVAVAAEPAYSFLSTLPELDGGVFLAQLSQAMAEAALAVADWGEKGKKAQVKVEFVLVRIGKSRQVELQHKLSVVRPTRRGKSSEELTTETPLYVGRKGALSIAPENQIDLFRSEP